MSGQVCDFNIRLRSSLDLFAQIALYPGPGRTGLGLKTIPRSKAVLYRLTDTSSMFFERGTGAAVL